MKSIKTLSFVALTALMTIALISASSAVAESTALCKADENPCAEVNRISSMHEVTVGKETLLTSVLNIACEVLFEGTILKSLASPLVISGSFTYTSCNTNCVILVENPPWELKVLKEGVEEGSLVGEGLVHLNCSGFVNCVYNGVGLKWTVKGPLKSTQANGEVSLSEQTMNKESGSLCAKTAKLDIVTSPLTAAYISS